MGRKHGPSQSHDGLSKKRRDPYAGLGWSVPVPGSKEKIQIHPVSCGAKQTGTILVSKYMV